jgi:predicted HAD superfamily Cof-like phosphohydrolase
LASRIAKAVEQFHEIMGQPVNGEWSEETLAFRRTLLDEEHEETIAEIDAAIAELNTFGYVTHGTKVSLLKELTDIAYVTYGTAIALYRAGALDDALLRTHLSNLTKLVDGKPLKREDGKPLKGPNYVPPDLEDLV